MDDKPRHRSGYSDEGLAQVKAACLTLALTLGAYLDDVCIVGGLVPALLVGELADEDDEPHAGTNDLDVGLALALLDDQRYVEIGRRLRAEGFRPDTNANGNPTVQRWRMGHSRVTVDFLIPPADDQPPLRLHNLQPDLGALITPGLDLAFDERVQVELEGDALGGEHVRRTIPVCGPAAFVVLKALAFADRAEPKDAYDIVYVIQHTPGRGRAIAERLRGHAEAKPEIVSCALGLLERDFDSPDGVGPRRAAQFTSLDPGDIDEATADSHGHVDDLVKAWREGCGRGQGPP